MRAAGYLIGIDVGGTDTKLGVFCADGTLVGKRIQKTICASDGSGTLPKLSEWIDGILHDASVPIGDVHGVGLGLPGVVDMRDESRCPNVDVSGSAVDAQLKRMFSQGAGGADIFVRIVNDADAAALGETWRGSASSYDDVLMVTLGTGVGGGVVSGGKLLAGAVGAAGEIGHLTVDPLETAACGCGRHGCLEQYVSARGMAMMAARELAVAHAVDAAAVAGVAAVAGAAGVAGADSPLARLGYADVERGRELGAKPIFDAARVGDVLACRLVERFIDILGHALAQIACVVNPAVIVIGGGMSLSGDLYLDRLARCYAAAAFPPCSHAKVVLSSLGNDAGMYGAAYATIER